MPDTPLKNHFDKLGIEYQTKSEINKKQRFSEVFIDLCNFYGISNKVLEAENDNANIIQIFEAFFSMGYYEGLEYGLNNNEHTVEINDTDLLTKHQDLIAREFNK